MAWKVYGDWYTTAQLSDASKFQTITPNANMILRAVRARLIFYNDPAFTDLNCKIYSNDTSGGSNSPNVLLSTSDSIIKSQILTLDNGVREVYFNFNYLPLHADTKYNVVINGTGYTGNSSSHIAINKAWPQTIYGGFTPAGDNLLTAPNYLYFVGYKT